MKCARCSAEVPSHSQFCLRCGTATNAAAGYPSPAAAPPYGVPAAPAQNNRALIVTVGILAVAVLAMAAFLIQSTLAQKSGTAATPSLVQAPAKVTTGPLVQVPAETKSTTPVLAPPAATTPEPNYAEIDDYLKFVRQVERTKQGLIHRELANALSQYGNMMAEQVKAATDDEASKDFLPNVNKNPKNFSAEWNNLTQIFLQRTPPQGCVKLHDLYYDHLGQIQGMFNKIHDATAQANSGNSGDALNALTAMMGTASSQADETAVKADDELGDICRACKLEKTFKISTDSGSTGSLLH